MSQADRSRVHATTVEEWRAWLLDHHETSDGVYLVSWKKHTGKPRVEYGDAVVEALAVGWVDSKPAALDHDRSMLWFSPRNPASAWSRPNKERVAMLEAAGRLAPAGRRLVEQAKENGAWTRLDDVEDGVVPDDLGAALDAIPAARENWNALPRSAKRGILEWIVQAKRPETRARRVEETVRKAAMGERANQWPR